jgi:hypothetical protein
MQSKQNLAVSLVIIASLIAFGVISLGTKNITMINTLLVIFLVEHVYVVIRCITRLLDKKSKHKISSL